MKQHIVTVRSEGKLYTFLVTGRLDPDGHTRIGSETWMEIQRRIAAKRGHAFTVG